MTSQKISLDTELTSPAAGDYVPIVDISEVQNSRNKRSLLSTLGDWFIQTYASFTQSGSGNTLATTIAKKLQERKSVLDFLTDAERALVLANTLTDVTTNFQKAINSGYLLDLPAGAYGYTELVFDDCPGLIGVGMNKSLLKPMGNAGDIIYFGKTVPCQWGVFRDFGIFGNATTTKAMQFGNTGAIYAANLLFDSILVKDFTASGATARYYQCLQDIEFRNCKFKNNYRHAYRPDVTQANGFCTTVRENGQDGMLDTSTGDAAIVADGQLSGYYINGPTIRANVGGGIKVGTSTNNNDGNLIVISGGTYFEQNNLGNSANADIEIAGPTAANSQVLLIIDNAAFHTQANAMDNLKIDYVNLRVGMVDGFDLTKINDTAHSSSFFLGPNFQSASGAGANILYPNLRGKFYAFDVDPTTGWYGVGSTGLKFLNGLIGTETNDNAAAAHIGEVIKSTVSTFANTAVNTEYGNVDSISLTRGDWDVYGQVWFNLNGATIDGNCNSAISVNSGNTTTDHVSGDNVQTSPTPTAAYNTSSSIAYRLSLSSTTTVYLKAAVGYSAGQPRAMGTIWARRAR